MWGLEEVFGEGDLLAGSVAGGYEGQPLKAGGAAQPGGCSACFVPVEPGSWDLSMEVPCFVDGRGILVELSMKSACFMDGGSVLNCAPKVGHNKFKHERIKVSN